MDHLGTKILVDGGDPRETQQVKERLGFVDGQTTNPSLIAKNPRIQQRLAAGHKLTQAEELNAYRDIVREIAPLVRDAGVSIEVFADTRTSAEQMVAQGKEMFAWIPNAYIKYPCTAEGLRAAQLSVRDGLRVNLTLCFSQQQAAAVYAATKGSRTPAYVSPFVGRLDDIGKNGMDLVRNIQSMFQLSDGHLLVLAASIRSVEQLLYCLSLNVDLVTAPAKILLSWADQGLPRPEANYEYRSPGQPIPYEELDLAQPWERFNIDHELTTKGLQKFAEDYRKTLAESAD
jgi:transaldolase